MATEEQTDARTFLLEKVGCVTESDAVSAGIGVVVMRDSNSIHSSLYWAIPSLWLCETYVSVRTCCSCW
jgi:hypothetical protein